MNRVAFIDVDDTLIRTVGTKRIPIVHMVRHVRALYESGWTLYCWSSGGADYCREAAIELSLQECFTGYLPKPTLMIDDVDPQAWPFLKVVHPNEVNVNQMGS